MGLDMYLYKKMYVGNTWKEPKEQLKVKIEGVNQARVSTISELVGQWRKANMIHQWFVDNIQEGDDDCKEYDVDVEDLKKLLKVVNEVLENSELIDGEIVNGYTFENGVKKPMLEKGKIVKNPEIADKLLPTASGCFFGGTDYDQYYIYDLEYTKDLIEKLLIEVEKDTTGIFSHFTYQSSW